MSIYATLWALKFPRYGDDYPGCEWTVVTAQGVPSHIGAPIAGGESESIDPYADFLPPPVRPSDSSEPRKMRAVVFVAEGTRKGTARSGQEYVDPLLVLTGEAYATMTFDDLHAHLCDALRGDRRQVVATIHTPGGCRRTLFEGDEAEDA